MRDGGSEERRALGGMGRSGAAADLPMQESYRTPDSGLWTLDSGLPSSPLTIPVSHGTLFNPPTPGGIGAFTEISGPRLT